MKFPVERAKIYNTIKESLINCDYKTIYNLKDDLFTKYDDIEKDEFYFKESFNALILSAFELEKYNDVILITEELNKFGFESFFVLYYCLLSIIAVSDIYKGISLIKKSPIINTIEMQQLRISDGANYNSLINYPKYTKRALVICNFIEGLIKEINNVVDENKYIIFRSFELVDVLYGLGYEDEFIMDLSNFFEKVFLYKEND